MPDRRPNDLRLRAAVSLLSWLLPMAAVAQEPASPPPVPTGPLTLEQVLTLAEPRSEALSIAITGVRRAEADQVRARSGLRPQVSASASYDRTFASEFDVLLNTENVVPPCPPFLPDPFAPIEARVGELERAVDCEAAGQGLLDGNASDGGGPDLSALPFGRRNAWRATLQLTQNLYSGGRNGAQIALAAAGHDSAELGVTTARAEFLFEVAQAYYDAVLADRLVTIAAATLEQASATLRQTEVGLAAGTQPEFEVLRARVARDNQLPLLIRQRVTRDVAYLRLKRLLDLAPTADLQLADPLSDELLPPPPVFAERVSAIERVVSVDDPAAVVAGAPLPDRTIVAQAATTVRLREAALDLAEAQKMPTLTLNSTYGRTSYPSGAWPTFDRTNWSLGVSFAVPILTGGRQRGDEGVARAEADQARLQQRQVAELADVDTRATWASLIAARAAWEATAGTVQQADRAYQIADVRYGAGVSTQLELDDARVLLQQAEANRAQAARDLQVARARVALLPDLPLGAAGAATVAATAAIAAPPTPSAPAQNNTFRNALGPGVAGVTTPAGTR